MKSLIVIYLPMASEEQAKVQNKQTEQDYRKIKNKTIFNDFHLLTIQDPDREKVEVEVFFKPEQYDRD
jgi:hypothetical protein